MSAHPTSVTTRRPVVPGSPLNPTDLQSGSSMMEFTREMRLLRAPDVVALTGWCRAKVYAMAVSGEIPSLRSGGSISILLTALERRIEKNTSGGLEP
jgi:predicted DNA-binding transcriptional regulator AlpA